MNKKVVVFAILLFLLFTVSAANAEKIPVIVVMKEKPTVTDFQLLKSQVLKKQQTILSILNEHKVKGKVSNIKQLWIINAISCEVTSDVLEELKKRDDVEKVIPDYKVRLKDEYALPSFFKFEQEIKKVTPVSEQWNLELINAYKVWANGINGSGINVSVIDTGVDADHPELSGKVILWHDFVNGQGAPYDDNGHGTHVAGTIAGNTVGVAPGVNLIVGKVFNSNGLANASDVIAAFQWAAENGADVISYSGGAIGFDDEGWKDGLYGSVEAGENTTIQIHVNESFGEEAFKPAFIIVGVGTESGEELSNLTISMINPSGNVVPGYMIDWLYEVRENIWFYKFIFDEPLQNGNWTLNITSIAESNTMWYSGSGNNLDNTLTMTFNLSDVSTATLLFETKYDMEEAADVGYVEINVSGTWIQLGSYTGHSNWTAESINLTPYAGQNVNIRFRYVTDSTVTSFGWLVDNISIPEIGFSDSVDYDLANSSWEANGWIIVDNPIFFGYAYLVAYPSDGTDLLSQTANMIAGNGTVIVAAAGNEGELGLRTINSPACANKVIAVGALESGWDLKEYIAWFSSRGPAGWGVNETIKPDVVAPGVDIVSAYPDDDYAEMSGTSMATPHVSGVVALMLQANSSLTPEEVKSILKSSAVDLGKPGEDNTYGAGLVDAYLAVSNVTSLEEIEANLFAGTFRDTYYAGDNITIVAIEWNKGPVENVEIYFNVSQYTSSYGYLEIFNSTALTDSNGFASVIFNPSDTGSYEITIGDEFGNKVTQYISVDEPPITDWPFTTDFKEYTTQPNGTIDMMWTFVDQDMKPYNDNITLKAKYYDSGLGGYVEFINETITPINGTIGYRLNLSEFSFDDGVEWDSYYINAYSEDGSYWRNVGSLIVTSEPISVVLIPGIIKAKPNETVDFILMSYDYLSYQPFDGSYNVTIEWLTERDVKSLAEINSDLAGKILANKLLSKDDKAKLRDALKNLVFEHGETYILDTADGYAIVTTNVPENAYFGWIMVEGIDSYTYVDGIVYVDFSPWIAHEIPMNEMRLWAEWDGGWNALTQSVTPDDYITVYAELMNESGEPISNELVYFFTEGDVKVAVTDVNGQAMVTLNVSYNASRSLPDNEIQVIALHNSTWAYTYVSPPTQWTWVDAWSSGDYLNFSVWHEFKDMDVSFGSITEVNKESVETWSRSAISTYFSEYWNKDFLKGSIPVDYGIYEVKDIFRFDPSGDKYWFSFIILGDTPLQAKFADYYLTNATIPIPVNIGEAGIVYMVYFVGEFPYGDNESNHEFYPVAPKFTYAIADENGNATLYLTTPDVPDEDVWYIIGFSTANHTFVGAYGGHFKTVTELYNITGTVFYDGNETGDIFVMALTELGAEPAFWTVIPSPGYYELPAANGTYYVLAFMDVNGNYKPDLDEPFGFYTTDGEPFPVTVAGADVSNINITLEIPELYNITGTVFYDGNETGDIFVMALTELGAEPAFWTVIPSPGYYELPAANGTYYVLAFMDVNGNQMPDEDEPIGFYTNDTVPSTVTVAGADVSNINITLEVPAPKPTPPGVANLTCAGMCHANYKQVDSDYVANTLMNFSVQSTILGIFKEYILANTTSWVVPNPVIEFYYNTSELFPPHTRGTGLFDSFAIHNTPAMPDYETAGYIRWNLSDLIGPVNFTRASDFVEPGLVQDYPGMSIMRDSEYLIFTNKTYHTNVSVEAIEDCFRVSIEVFLENNTFMDANFTGYATNVPPNYVYMEDKYIRAVFENAGSSPNPTNGTFNLTVFYDVTKFTSDVLEFKPRVKVALRERIYSEHLNGTVYMNSYNVSYDSIMFDRNATFSSSAPQNWTTEEFFAKVIELSEYFNVTSIAFYNITGTVFYDGNETGIVYVGASLLPGEPPEFLTAIDVPGDYMLHVPNGTYYVGAFMDVNGNQMPDEGEPMGQYPEPVVVAGADVSNINITLEIPAPKPVSNMVYLDDLTLHIGEERPNVPLRLLNSTGVGGLQVVLYFNSSVINITDATAGDFNSIFNVDYSNVTDGILRITCMKLGQDLVGDLIIANLTINALAEGISPLNISAELTMSNGTSVEETVRNATIVVTARIPGDVTGDGNVNIQDAVLLFNWVSFPNDRGTKYIINEANGDVTGDGNVNIQDAVLLFNWVSFPNDRGTKYILR